MYVDTIEQVRSRISIILISYNNLQYLEESLGSVLEQDYEDIELIVADDGTPTFEQENVEKILSKYNCQGLKRVVIYTNETNEGTVRNINKAIEYTTGTYIKILACDDKFFSKNTLSLLVGEMEKTGANILTTPCAIYNATMQELKGYYPKKKTFEKLSKMTSHELLGELMKSNAIGAVGVCFKAGFLKSLGGFDTSYKLLEDWPLWLKLSYNKEPIHFFTEISEKYRLGGICNKDDTNLILMQDMKKMYDQLIIPYSRQQGYWIRREVNFTYQRLFMWKQLSFLKRLETYFRYIDIIIIRKIRNYI